MKRRYVPTSASVPPELKARMGSIKGVNRSSAACEAFRRHIEGSEHGIAIAPDVLVRQLGDLAEQVESMLLPIRTIEAAHADKGSVDESE